MVRGATATRATVIAHAFALYALSHTHAGHASYGAAEDDVIVCALARFEYKSHQPFEWRVVYSSRLYGSMRLDASLCVCDSYMFISHSHYVRLASGASLVHCEHTLRPRRVRECEAHIRYKHAYTLTGTAI